ncbi:general substrate transporter [Talaromyces proteolyticus]|uniref:General substrate transporter n=1 Tax=Talaromyces proteolyticus TaxID=1131652 RepID=A0AAD4KZK8_9EURO|nr:general substrate transporter [Talaromyces proteolyticus]KAH8703036.1 general substrate transporter [Talaromyces proteolyticus]
MGFSLQDLTLSTLVVSLLGSLGGVSFGIDYGYWSGMLGMTQFKKDFGVYNSDTDTWGIPSSWQSAGSGAPIAALAVGALISGAVGQQLGRLRVFRIGSVVVLIGVVIQSSSIRSFWQIVGGRIVTTIALGILANAIPAYLAECAPLAIRGTVINCYQFSISVGAILVNTGNWGMQGRTDQWAYRMVIVLQAVIPCFFLLGSFFIPESPRWLLGQGRQTEAQRSLEILRSNTRRDVIEREIQLILASEEENRHQFNSSWVDCFKGSNLRRTLIATGVQCLQQAQGNSFMASYCVTFFEAIGFNDVYKITVLFYLCMVVGTAVCFYLPDRVGRRWLMISTALIMGVCMFVVAVITGSSLAQNVHAMKGAIGAIFIWQFLMAIGWSSCVWIVTAEMPSLMIREKSIMTATFCGFCVSIIVTFVNPYIQNAGYGNLQGRIGFLYGSFSFVSAIWTLLFLPETRNRNLEELDELFQNKVSVWKFPKYQTTGYGAQLTEVEEVAHRGEDFSEKEATVRFEDDA